MVPTLIENSKILNLDQKKAIKMNIQILGTN